MTLRLDHSKQNSRRLNEGTGVTRKFDKSFGSEILDWLVGGLGFMRSKDTCDAQGDALQRCDPVLSLSMEQCALSKQ